MIPTINSEKTILDHTGQPEQKDQIDDIREGLQIVVSASELANCKQKIDNLSPELKIRISEIRQQIEESIDLIVSLKEYKEAVLKEKFYQNAKLSEKFQDGVIDQIRQAIDNIIKMQKKIDHLSKNPFPQSNLISIHGAYIKEKLNRLQAA